MPNNPKRRGFVPTLERLEDRRVPSLTPLSASFDTTSVGRPPSGWAQWSSTGQPAFTVSGQTAVSPGHSLAASTPKNWVTTSAWNLTQEPADIEVSASLYPNRH